MFRWNMSLETGIEPVDLARRNLLEAMAEFFRILDDPLLDQAMIAERTGLIFLGMKAAFAAEDAFFTAQGLAAESHRATHSALLLAYVDLCKKVVPRIRTLKQAQQICLEIYRIIDGSLYDHLKNETLDYKMMLRPRVSVA